MTLRYQLNLRILVAFIGIVMMAGTITIWQARNAVEKEIESSINLAVQLISFSLSRVSHTTPSESDWLAELNALKETRHLSIQLKKSSGEIISLSSMQHKTQPEAKPPRWFINLVGGHYPEVERQLTGSTGEHITLVLMANPLDEITEVWQESLAFFGAILILALFIFLAIQGVFSKAIKAIAHIVDALKIIETGQYEHQLPTFSSREFTSIAKAINHMTAVLNDTQIQNRALTQHSLAIQETERQRLAQELHDELGQSLTAIKVMAVTATHERANIPGIAESISHICDHLMQVVRSMMQQLHPLILSELGLKAAVEDLVLHYSARHPELTLDLTCDDQVDDLEQAITIQLYRVVQECLTNIVRHAQADKVTIDLAIEQNPERYKQIRLQIRDDGRGCSAIKIKSGFGVLSMRERITSLGGELDIQTQPGKGMQIIATIPLP
jgi:two-component system, NarL family, sensor histidine kinase UhpB